MTFFSQDAGSEAWWQAIARQGTPLVVPVTQGISLVTFLWREPAGNASLLAVRRVWLNITGITDHHSQTPPRSLKRVPGTDIWQTSLLLSNQWRGSYAVIPDTGESYPAHSLTLSNLRHWWQHQLPQAQPDPLNPHQSWRSARGHWVSPLHMPAAPPQPEWQTVRNEEIAGEWVHLSWSSALLKNRRDISVLITGASAPARRPLAIFLDGQFWSGVMPVAPPLREMTRRGELPEAVYLFIDSVNNAQRSQELPCNATFWLAVQQELLPLIQSQIPFSNQPQETAIIGQSFGGLSALYAVLNWPQRFGCALSQSGSFWWPARETGRGQQPGELIQQLKAGKALGHTLRIAMDAGLHEKIILEANRQMIPLLTKAGHHLRYREIEGGHDALCWRGGITDGLRWLWSTLPVSE